MNWYGVIVCCLFVLNVTVANTDDDTVTVEVPKVIAKRRKVKQIRPHWASQTGGDNFRATTFSDDGSYWNTNNNQFSTQSYATNGGTPPWNYGNQQGGSGTGQQGGQQTFENYPPTSGQGHYQGPQYPGNPSGSQQPQPGYPSPSYPTQTGYPQPGQPGSKPIYPQGPRPGQPSQPSYPQGPQTGVTQPGYPQRPNPSYPQRPNPGYPQRPTPGYPQQPRPVGPAQPEYPQRPQRPGSQPGTFQQPSPPGSQPPLAQRPPDNQIFPGSPFYPQIQPGLTEPPEGVQSELQKYCRAPRGQFAIETSCNKYVNCWDDVVVEQECGGNLVFNEEKKYCDFPENVNCGNRPYTENRVPVDGNCSTPFATYRSSVNCGEFFICVHGIPYRFMCPRGLAYSNDLGICDYPHRVSCDGVPLLLVEETSGEPDYQNEHGNTGNENNYGGSSNENNYGGSNNENNYGGSNNENTNYGNTNNGNYYGSYGSSGTKPYRRT